MKTIQKYFLKELIKIFIPASIFLILIFALSEFFWRLPDFLSYKAKTAVIIRYLLNLIPLWFIQTLPITTMISTLLTITHFMYTKELTVIKTLGIDSKKFFLSWIVGGIILSLTAFLINENLATSGFLNSQKILSEEIKKETFKKDLLKDLFYFDNIEKTFVYLAEYNKKTTQVKNIIIEKFNREHEIENQIVSRLAIKEKDTLKLYKPVLRKFLNNEFKKEEYLEQYLYKLPLDIEEFQYDYSSMQLDYLKISELKKVKKVLLLRGQNPARIQTEISFRYSASFLNFILVIFSLALGQNISSQYGKLSSFLYTIISLIIYWLFLSFFRTLGELDIINPTISVWIPNILFLITGTILYSKTK